MLGVRDISSLLLDGHGRLRVVPARALEGTTARERLVFGVRHGLYSFSTEELCDFLRARIRGKTAIEIGAGHGALAKALSIPATDNRQQEEAVVKAHYQRIGQPTVPYGEHVEKLDAVAAVQRYRPNIVIACWVTHLFDANRSDAGGNMFGVDEAGLIASCDEYVVGADANLCHFAAMCRLSDEPGISTRRPHLYLIFFSAGWRSRTSARWLRLASAPTAT